MVMRNITKKFTQQCMLISKRVNLFSDGLDKMGSYWVYGEARIAPKMLKVFKFLGFCRNPRQVGMGC